MEKFQVDLHGIVEILSRHLYSSPRVFVRELLQNGVDALTARRQLDPQWQGHLTITALPDGSVQFADDGIGLSADEVRELLATIGRSSKRDELDMQREGYLGQFGIGLLSCFLVSDTIEVRTRSAREPDAPTVLWIARGDGTYELTETEPLADAGTVVTLRPRRGETWLRPQSLLELARHYGAILPMPITFSDNGLRTQVAPQRAPWELEETTSAQYCRDTFGFEPMAQIPLEVPVAGVRGIAYVQPTPANPAAQAKHRVYLRRMLLGESVTGLLPDWASFVRVVVDVEGLKPTASREALYDDANLRATRRALGDQLRRWMVETDAENPSLLQRLMNVHWLTFGAAAQIDDEVLAIVRRWMQWETSTGSVTMTELLQAGKTLHYCGSRRGYEALQAVAAGRGMTVVNASFTNSLELLRRFAEVDPQITLRSVTLSDLLDDRSESDPATEELTSMGTAALESFDCEVGARPFQPASTPALYVVDPDRAAHARSAARRAAAADDPLLGALLGTDAPEDDFDEPFATLVLNTLNPAIQALYGVPAQARADLVRHIYAIATLTSGGTAATRDLLTDTLLSLINHVTADTDDK